MEHSKWLQRGIGGLLVASSLLKLTAISYVANMLFVLLPLRWAGTFLVGHLGLVVIAASSLELGMGLALWSRYGPRVLPWVAVYLLFMIFI